MRTAVLLFTATALACAGGNHPEGSDPMESLVDDGALIHHEAPSGPFTPQDFASWGLGGEWTLQVDGLSQPATFTLEGERLVLEADYGRFRGGLAADGVLALSETTGPPGPPTTTWINLRKAGSDRLEGAVQALGGDEDQPGPVVLERR